ncbi:hypothetical protein EKG38_12405 [Shewanella canadensis]|uniref:Uncharacterized protein n=1 Tax=Shewanella canadensis TaxID=271096 RepID=A0A431WV50_9GAMM|nr:hypothetical protein [Shewanella canadensis]RTR38944.1 hypothetical protein EKG38_12405 [Shewanella canadensis]
MRYVLVLVALLSSFYSRADAIDDIFSEGVFDTKWGGALSEVKEIFPNAEKKSINGLEWLEDNNSKEVLGFERDDEKFQFFFDSEGRLNGVGVYFSIDHYGELFVKLETLFGAWKKGEGTNIPYIQWVSESGITLTLTSVPSAFSIQTMLSIGYPNLEPAKTSKDSLGF